MSIFQSVFFIPKFVGSLIIKHHFKNMTQLKILIGSKNELILLILFLLLAFMAFCCTSALSHSL